MLGLGIIAIIIGGGLLYYGNTLNNDVEVQLESIWNDGVANPGANYETIGVIVLIVGIVLLFVGLLSNTSNSQRSGEHIHYPPIVNVNHYCESCGASLPENAKFCARCGHATVASAQKDDTVSCPHCGGNITPGNRFCMYCGKQI